MFCLRYLSIIAALATVATFISTSNALPTSDNATIPLGPDALITGEPYERGPYRRGIGSDIFTAAIWGLADAAGKGAELQKIFGKLFGDKPTTCCTYDMTECRYNAGKTKAEHGFFACYYEGDAIITDEDVEAMKCMINLHYLQEDKCISFEGSVCADGYPGGGLMRGQVDEWFTHHKDKRNKFSAQDTETLQAAAETMRGVKIGYALGSNAAIRVVVVDDKDGSMGAKLNFAGHQGQEC